MLKLKVYNSMEDCVYYYTDKKEIYNAFTQAIENSYPFYITVDDKEDIEDLEYFFTDAAWKSYKINFDTYFTDVPDIDAIYFNKWYMFVYKYNSLEKPEDVMKCLPQIIKNADKEDDDK